MTLTDPAVALVDELLAVPSIAHATALALDAANADPRDAGRMPPGAWLQEILDAVREYGTEDDKDLHDAMRFAAL